MSRSTCGAGGRETTSNRSGGWRAGAVHIQAEVVTVGLHSSSPSSRGLLRQLVKESQASLFGFICLAADLIRRVHYNIIAVISSELMGQ
jgi:hypothetical protein